MKDREKYLEEKIKYYKKCIDVAEDMAWHSGVTEEESEQLFIFVQKRLKGIEEMEKELEQIRNGK